MDVDTSDAAASMACVLNFIKKMLTIVSSFPPVLFLLSFIARFVFFCSGLFDVFLWH